MFHFNHNWTYYGDKSKWSFKGNGYAQTNSVDVFLYPERKCLACGRVEQLEGVLQSVGHLQKDWAQIYKSKYEADSLLDAVKKLYYAGYWSSPNVTEAAADLLWKDLRDAAKLTPGATALETKYRGDV